VTESTYTYVRGDHALLMHVYEDGLAVTFEHIAVAYPVPEGPCAVFGDGRFCVTDHAGTFKVPPDFGPEEADVRLRAEWEQRWGDLSDDRG